jgi:hypothetical protein
MFRTGTFGRWTYTVDPDATAEAYKAAIGGGADYCDCNGCRNFRLVRHRIHTPEFLTLLATLGIDPRKEAEAIRASQSSPGHYSCGGWFHFVGDLKVSGDFPPVDLGAGVTAWMTHGVAPMLQPLAGFPLVQLGFWAESVPWLLDEPEPT